MNSVLITGGCGFIGATIAISIKEKYPEYRVIAFDNLKRRGSELSISRLKANGVEYIHGDIRNKSDLLQIDYVNTIIDAAAEPSVLAGLDGSPDYLVNTNIIGTFHCLELARKFSAKFIFLSTSRVYPITTLESLSIIESETRFILSKDQQLPGVSDLGINENFPINAARSLYGATKLASELLVQEYNALMGLTTVINRCGVITGPWQMGKIDQGVAVLWMAKHFWSGELGYNGYGGSGKQVRDILHVLDLFRLVDWQMHNIDMVSGKLFNVGGGLNVSVSLKELTSICETITGNIINVKSVLENRKADIPLYITDNSLITSISGWQPIYTPDQIMKDIFDWLSDNEKMLKDIFL